MSNSTPIYLDGRPVALLHFEAGIEALRQRLIAFLDGGTRARLVDTATAELIFDTAVDQPVGKAPFTTAGVVRSTGSAVRAAAEVTVETGNDNRWTVEVITAGAPVLPFGRVVTLLGLVAVTTVMVVIIAVRFSASLVRPIRQVADRPRHSPTGTCEAGCG